MLLINCSLGQSICRAGVIQVKNRPFMPHDDFHVVILSVCVDYLTLTDPDAALDAVRKNIADNTVSLAFVLDYASRLITAPGHLSARERQQFVKLLKISQEALRKPQKANFSHSIVLIGNNLNEFPSWLYLDNPLAKPLNISLPQLQERRCYFAMAAEGFFNDIDFSIAENESSKKCSRCDTSNKAHAVYCAACGESLMLFHDSPVEPPVKPGNNLEKTDKDAHSPQAQLVCLSQPEFVFPVKNCQIVGRRGDVDITPLEKSIYISGEHARFSFCEGRWFLEHLSRTNSTYVNGIKLQPSIIQQLHDEDKITLANTTFLFREV